MGEQRVLDFTNDFLNILGECTEVCNTASMWKFLEVSPFSFEGLTSKKCKEGFVKKSTGGRNMSQVLCDLRCKRWQKRWLIIKENYIGYILDNRPGRHLREVLTFNH